MKRTVIYIYLLITAISTSCTCLGQIIVKDSLVIYHIPPNNHYLISVTEATILNKEGVSILETTDSRVIDKLKSSFVTNIKSPELEEYKDVDGRVLLWFKSKNSSQKVLINKFGYFLHNGIVYDGTDIAINVLQDEFPEIIFMKDLK